MVQEYFRITSYYLFRADIVDPESTGNLNTPENFHATGKKIAA